MLSILIKNSKYILTDENNNEIKTYKDKDFPIDLEKEEKEYLKFKIAKENKKEELQSEKIRKLESDIIVLQNYIVEQQYKDLMKGAK